MTGMVRDGVAGARYIVDVGDDVLDELAKYGGHCLVIDSLEARTPGRVEYDHDRYVIRLECRIERLAQRKVKVVPRLVLAAQGARP